jgi:hypothetical protein
MPSTAREESFEALDEHGVARRRSPSEQARRHRRRRAWPVVTLALEKPLFRNVSRKRRQSSRALRGATEFLQRMPSGVMPQIELGELTAATLISPVQDIFHFGI